MNTIMTEYRPTSEVFAWIWIAVAIPMLPLQMIIEEFFNVSHQSANIFATTFLFTMAGSVILVKLLEFFYGLLPGETAMQTPKLPGTIGEEDKPYPSHACAGLAKRQYRGYQTVVVEAPHFYLGGPTYWRIRHSRHVESNDNWVHDGDSAIRDNKCPYCKAELEASG